MRDLGTMSEERNPRFDDLDDFQIMALIWYKMGGGKLEDVVEL